MGSSTSHLAKGAESDPEEYRQRKEKQRASALEKIESGIDFGMTPIVFHELPNYTPVLEAIDQAKLKFKDKKFYVDQSERVERYGGGYSPDTKYTIALHVKDLAPL